MKLSRVVFVGIRGGRLPVVGVLTIGVLMISVLSAGAAEKPDSSRPRKQKREAVNLRGSANDENRGESEYRFHALLGAAKFQGTETEREVTYEERVITYTVPETVYKTVYEDQSGWQLCCCRTLFGWRERCVWCPGVLEKQVPEVVEMERERVERISHVNNREVPATAIEPVVVHSRRPYVKKTFNWDEPQFVAERKTTRALETAERNEGSGEY